MQIVLSALLLLLAALNLVLGTGFLVNPGNAAADFGLVAANTHGLSTLRGDMTAFFYVSALSLGIGGWERNGALLLPALGLYGIAFTGRAGNLAGVGTYPDWAMPMAVEGGTIVLLLVALKVWGWQRPAA